MISFKSNKINILLCIEIQHNYPEYRVWVKYFAVKSLNDLPDHFRKEYLFLQFKKFDNFLEWQIMSLFNLLLFTAYHMTISYILIVPIHCFSVVLLFYS